MATTITTTAEQLRSAVALLRGAGHEAEARAVEALLREREPARRRSTKPPIEGVMPIAEAAKRLGTSRAAIQRRIDLGMLAVERDPESNERFVTRQSLEDFVEGQRLLATASAPIPGLEHLDTGEPTQIGQMFAVALRERALREAAEIDAEARDDEAAKAEAR